MSSRITVVAAVAAAVIIAAAILFAVREPAGRAAVPAVVVAPAAPPAAAPPEEAAAEATPSAAPVRTVPPAVPLAPATGPGPMPWNAVPVSARPSELGPEVAGPVLQGLEAARDRMDPCFTAEAERLRAYPQLSDPSAGTPILLLHLESIAGAIVVVDAEVDAPGRASAQLLACCRDVLRASRIPAVHAPPGERYRLRYVLQ